MIDAVTPGSLSKHNIPRITVTSDDIEAVGKVDIKHFIPETDGSQLLRYRLIYMV